MEKNDSANLGPHFRLLTEAQIQDLHLATLHVLEQTGVRVEGKEALDLLQGAGAKVEPNGIVRLPPQLVEQAISTAPQTVTLYHRDQQGEMVLEGRRFYFGTGSGCPFTYDLDSGELRRTIKKDTEKFARLADFLPNIDFVMSMGNCSDVPSQAVYWQEFQGMVTQTTKPICFTAETLEDVKRIYEASAVIAGDMDRFRAHPFAILYDEPQAPLCHPRPAVEKLLYCAQARLPVVYAAGVAAGGTGPATLAGAVVQANAEELSGLVIHQLRAQGAPFVYGCTVTILDMATSNYTHGCPEQFVMNTARAELAHFYDLPIFGVGGRTDSKAADVQAGIEYALSAFLEVLCGAGMIHDVGYLGTGLVSSYEMTVLADELAGMIKRIKRGIDINPETLAEEVIGQVGPGGQYLTHDHTRRHFRKEFWFPEFMNRDNLALWQEKGRPELNRRLNQKAKEILKEHQPPQLPEDVLEKISKILS
ncbi:MAG: trimethylamine methyltransferase family protein [Deltaproteobacteria bacterium]|nr:trimethylamine methyltransferase family protein [Deltaproteobacteria bacterium]